MNQDVSNEVALTASKAGGECGNDVARMPPEPCIEVKRHKSFAKLVKRRCALSHAIALLSVFRASRYRDLGELRGPESMDDSDELDN